MKSQRNLWLYLLAAVCFLGASVMILFVSDEQNLVSGSAFAVLFVANTVLYFHYRKRAGSEESSDSSDSD